MRPPRRRIDGNQNAIVSALRAVGCSVAVTSSLGNGFPDLLVSRGGDRNVLMELKSGPGDELTLDEKRWHAAWRGPLVVVRTVDEALWAVGIHEKRED